MWFSIGGGGSLLVLLDVSKQRTPFIPARFIAFSIAERLPLTKFIDAVVIEDAGYARA